MFKTLYSKAFPKYFGFSQINSNFRLIFFIFKLKHEFIFRVVTESFHQTTAYKKYIKIQLIIHITRRG
jgi:hypothetical protein